MLVTRHCTNDCILGEPFACRASLQTARTPSGKCMLRLSSEDGKRTVSIQASAGISSTLNVEISDDENDQDWGKEVAE